MKNGFYRPEIDGLRALAIVPVLLFHAGVDYFSGGFVGVDVFFVISGFLITSIIYDEILKQTFTFKSFYTRRIRRLVPALVAVYLSTAIVFYFIYPAFLYEKTLESLLSSIFFSSNIYFWKQGGYFATASELHPLLHTWSLSVEEQFYVIFPLALFLFYKVCKSHRILITSIFAVCILSLALSVYFSPPRGSFAAFYLLPTRVFELGAGALLALCMHNKREAVSSNWISGVGFVAIIFAILFFDESTAFPSYNALMPVLGAVLIIYGAGLGTLVHRLLSSKLCVNIGLISYSLYIWHWPVIVYANWVLAEYTPILRTIISLTASGIFAAASYRLIEQPFRKRTFVSDKNMFAYGLYANVFVMVMSFAVLQVGNKTAVYTDTSIENKYFEAVQPEPQRGACTDIIRNSGAYVDCAIEGTNKHSFKVFVWGDSHASAMIPAFNKVAQSHSVHYATTTGCPPLLGVYRTDLAQQCRTVNEAVFKHIAEEDYDLVYLVGAFNNYLNWELIGMDGVKAETSTKQVFETALKTTVTRLSEKVANVVIVKQPPRFEEDIPLAFLRQNILNDNYTATYVDMAECQRQLADFEEVLAELPQVESVSVSQFMCTATQCNAADEAGNLYYKDKHHISNHFTTLIEDHLLQTLETFEGRERSGQQEVDAL